MNDGETPATAGWLISLPCISSRVTASQLVLFASVSGWLQASQFSLYRWLGNCEPAGLPYICSWVTESQPAFLVSADSVAVRSLAIAVCTPDNLSWCKRRCDWLDCWEAAFYTLSLVVPEPVGFGAALICADCLVLASMWEAPTPVYMSQVF
jgi:hypothetical protein